MVGVEVNVGEAVSAVVLAWNSSRYLRPTLTALLKQREEVPTEIIVVDNGSTDGSPDIVREVAPDAYVIRNERNLGVARARNQGLRVASGKYILLLDSDTEMTTGSLGQMKRFLDANPRFGIVGPKLIYSGGSVQFSCRRFPTVPGKLFRQLPFQVRKAISLVVEEELQNIDHSVAQPVDYVIGACQLIRRATLDQIGLLDERMFYAPEDVDLCLRAWQAGWEVYYLPSSVVVHGEQRLWRRRPGALTLKQVVGLMYYFWKHHYLWRRPNPRSAFFREGRGGGA